MRNKEKMELCEKKEGTLAAAGFALVLILVGVPVWWSTTTVYRAHLPYYTIDELASKDIYQSVHLNLIGENSVSLKEKLHKVLNEKENVRYLISSYQTTVEEDNILLSNLNSNELEEKLLIQRPFLTGSLNIYIRPTDTTNSSSIFISNKRLIIIKGTSDMNELSQNLHLMSLDLLWNERHLPQPHRLQDLKRIAEQTKSAMRQVPVEPGYDIIITLMLPEPHMMRAKWNASEAIKEYLSPLANQMKEITDLRIRSQILYMTDLKVVPKCSSEIGHCLLPEEQLPLTINDIEAKLGSFVSTRPSLHFIVYVPRIHEMPLVIYTKSGVPLEANSFLVPRWGSVLIHNPPKETLNILNASSSSSIFPLEFDIDSQWVMSTIVTHIYKLFPVPVLKRSEGVEIPIGSDALFADWQLDALARARVFAYLNSIKITLQSLGELVGEISNMVVSDEVAGCVSSAVSDWDSCLEAGKAGRLEDATHYCQLAFVHSDAAFFHPSMLALLYFPDNQKYAIYVPLFLPVSIPVLLSFKVIFKFLSGKLFKKEKVD